jgi:tetratricopeptide (TPR) repeat protein
MSTRTDPTTDASSSGKIIKRVVVSNASDEQFRLVARTEPQGVRILAEDVPGSLDAALRALLDSRTSDVIANPDIQEQWRTLLEALQTGGWTPHEEFQFKMEVSENDGVMVSRLTSPDTPSEQLADLYKSIHGRMASFFSDASHRFAIEIAELTSAGRHADAFAALQKAAEGGTFIGSPTRELVEAICTIDRAALPRADAFALWGRRINEKSRGRFYDDLDEDLKVLEGDFAAEIAAVEGWENLHLLIRAEMAAHANKTELAYARYRELVGRPALDVKLRARAHWGLFRVSEAHDANAVCSAEIGGDAYLEAGDPIQAVHCYAAGAELCEALDRPKALDLLNKALAVLDTQSIRSDEFRARILYTRAVIQTDWRRLPEALADALASVAIRKTLTGAEDGLMAGLRLTRRIAEGMGKSEDIARLDAEIEALRPRVGSVTRLRERIATTMSQGIEAQRQLHEEVLKQDDPKLTAESLLTLGVACMTASLPDALTHLEAGLAIVERTARLRRDLGLRALLEGAIGQAYCTHGDDLRAIPWLSRALAQDPRDQGARHNLVALLQKHKRYGELVPIMETQIKVYGELPGLLCVYGQALLGAGRPQAAIRELLRAREVCSDPAKMAGIDEFLRKARTEPPELDTTWTPVPPKRAITHDEFAAALDSFAAFIKKERRMSFWRTEEGTKKFKPSPEEHGKVLLHTFLRGKLGEDVTILEELAAGAGILDLWVEIPGGMRLVIELKMCGQGYEAGYAAQGIEQLAHYMNNKNTHLGHLIIFDARQRDFGKGLEAQVRSGAHAIAVRFVDIRPGVVVGAKRSGAARKAKAPRRK